MQLVQSLGLQQQFAPFKRFERVRAMVAESQDQFLQMVLAKWITLWRRLGQKRKVSFPRVRIFQDTSKPIGWRLARLDLA